MVMHFNSLSSFNSNNLVFPQMLQLNLHLIVETSQHFQTWAWGRHQLRLLVPQVSMITDSRALEIMVETVPSSEVVVEEVPPEAAIRDAIP